MSKINLITLILVLLSLLGGLAVNISAETTFFDNSGDSFIIDYSTTISPIGDGLGEITGRAIDESGCLTNWSCSSWSSCVDGLQIRNCSKSLNNCYADLKEKPAENQSCSIEAIIQDRTLNSSSKEEPFNWSYLLFSAMIALFCAGCVWIFRQREKIRYLIKKTMGRSHSKECGFKFMDIKRLFGKNDSQNNNINELINKKVYADNGDYIGKIKEVILEKNRAHSIKIDLDKRRKFKIKGIILGYSHIRSIGNIILIDNKVIEFIKTRFNNTG